MPRLEPCRARRLRCPPRSGAVRAAASGFHVVAGLLVGHAALADALKDDAPEAGPPGAERPSTVDAAERPSTVDAATLIRLGDRFRDTGRWALAKEAYRSAYLVGRDPRIRCEWGLAELAMSAHRDAATQLDACLKDPRAGTAQQRRRYTNGLEQARREVGQLDIEVSQPGTELFVDGKSHGKHLTTVFYLYVAPGTHTIKAALPGFLDAVQATEVERGDVAKVVLRLEPTPPRAAPAEARSAPPAPPAPSAAAGKAAPSSAPPGVFDGGPGAARICGIGMTALGLAAGAVSSIIASTHGAEAERRSGALRQRTSPTICASPLPAHAAECAVIDDLYDTHDIARNVATGFFIGAGAVAAATLASFVHHGLEHRARPVRVAPIAGAGGGGLMLQGAW
ncbi:PEGA domain-containing protein [Sorangium sp. So ce233]|uniref:PEGA domain-containing protein n=1 Tax=Sorangium sp. So ce233 TaxID=3133290 RepID=UPI003F61E5C5